MDTKIVSRQSRIRSKSFNSYTNAQNIIKLKTGAGVSDASSLASSTSSAGTNKKDDMATSETESVNESELSSNYEENDIQSELKKEGNRKSLDLHNFLDSLEIEEYEQSKQLLLNEDTLLSETQEENIPLEPSQENQAIEYSNNVYEFTAYKRNSKTYHLTKRRITIYRDRFTIWKKKKSKELSSNMIIQCRRSIKYPKKIRICWRFGKKIDDYLFQSIEQRERFYEVLWMSRHGIKSNSTVAMNIFIGTWNMGNSPPPSNEIMDNWIQSKKDYDMYVIGLQESDYNEKENNQSVESHLFQLLQSCLGKKYVKLAGISLSEIRMLILVKREHYYSITNLKIGTVACGVAGVMANKGGVGCSFRFYETTLGFVCSHLAAHQHKSDSRNDDYRTIVHGLTPSIHQLPTQKIDITNQFDHLFWLGDLNYRIDGLAREEVLQLILDKNWTKLTLHDQLRREIESGGSFIDFNEEVLVFKPTYKYLPGANEYSEEKPVRIPAWCDRVVWRSSPGQEGCLQHHSYGCCDEILTSDHHPVFATFNIQMKLPNLYQQRLSGCKIVVQNLRINDLRFADNDGEPSPYLCFIADFIEHKQKTPKKEKTRNPTWFGLQIELKPIVTMRDFLTSQSIRIMVGDKEKQKTQRWAQAAFSLRNLNKNPTPFSAPLTSFAYGGCGTVHGEVFIDFLSSSNDFLHDSNISHVIDPSSTLVSSSVPNQMNYYTHTK